MAANLMSQTPVLDRVQRYMQGDRSEVRPIGQPQYPTVQEFWQATNPETRPLVADLAAAANPVTDTLMGARDVAHYGPRAWGDLKANALAWRDYVGNLFRGEPGWSEENPPVMMPENAVMAALGAAPMLSAGMITYHGSPHRFDAVPSPKPPDYAGVHTAPMADGYSAPGWDVTQNIYPDDIYGPNAAQYYGSGIPEWRKMDREALDAINAMRGNPSAKVKVYRAVPKGVQSEIAPGDWVSTSRDYAALHGDRFDEGYDIIEKEVRASEIYTEGNGIHEWGYDPIGNPHGRFRASAIGSGEGAQARGYGHYLAEERGTAKTYMQPGGIEISSDVADQVANLPRVGFIQADARSVLSGVEMDLVQPGGGADVAQYFREQAEKVRAGKWPEDAVTYEALADLVESGKIKGRPGTLYTVDLPDEAIEQMLDWDGPIPTDAPDAVLDILGDYHDTVGEALTELKREMDPEEISRLLSEQGIPGIKFFDQGSRAAGEGTRNFVVFPGNEDLMTIVGRE